MRDNIEEFNQGVSLLNSKDYDGAISLFRQDLEKNPKNLASYHNIGLAQTFLGIEKQDKGLLLSAIQHIEKAIAIAKELNYEDGYPIAEANLKWSTEKLAELT